MQYNLRMKLLVLSLYTLFLFVLLKIWNDEMVKPSLGNKSVKCVVDHDDCIFTNDMETLLSCLEIEHPFVELLYQAVKSHKEKFGEGMRTYIFMVTRIAKAVVQLEELGIQKSTSLATIREIINVLLHQVKQISVSVVSSTCETVQENPDGSIFLKHFSPQNVLDDHRDEISTQTPKLISKTLDNEHYFLKAQYSSFENHPLQITEQQSHELNSEGNSIRSSSYSNLPSDLDYLNSDQSGNVSQKEDEQNLSPRLLNGMNIFSMNHYVVSAGDICSISSDTPNTNNIVESDPVMLKMSDISQGEEKDDIGWYFNESICKENPKAEDCFNIDLNARLATADKIVFNKKSNVNSMSDFIQTTKRQQINSVTENKREIEHSGSNNGNQHDSDFEDCFDDLENRKEVLVVVERIENADCRDWHALNNCEDEKVIMKTKMAHNVQKHFSSFEFETVSSIPSLRDSQVDEEFSDCFQNESHNSPDDVLSCDASLKHTPNPLKFSVCSSSYNDASSDEEFGDCIPNNHDNSFTSTGKLRSDNMPKISNTAESHKYDIELDEIKSPNLVSGYCSTELVTEADTANDFSQNKDKVYKHVSAIEKLNSILLSLNDRKSHNVKEFLISSRHNLNENYFKECTDDIVLESCNGSQKCFTNTVRQDKTTSTLTPESEHNETDLCNDLKEPIIYCEKELSLTERLTPLTLFDKTDTTRPVLPKAHHETELDKLNSALSSLNGKKSAVKKVQVTLSSRYALDKDFFVEDSQSLSENIIESDQSKRTFETPPQCQRGPFSQDHATSIVNLKATDSRLYEDTLNESSKIHHDSQVVLFQCKSNEKKSDLERQAASARGCYLSDDSQMGRGHQTSQKSLILPDDLQMLGRGDEDVMALVVGLYKSQVSMGRQRLNPNLINCVSLQCPKSSKTVIDGLAIPCEGDHLHALSGQFSQELNVLLINGDLTPTHRHMGYKPTVARKNLLKSSGDLGTEKQEVLWAHRIIDNMKLLHVTIIFIRGNTTSILSHACQSSGILLLTNTKYHALHVISHHLKIDMLAYAEDAMQENVSQLIIRPLNPLWMDRTNEDHCLVVSNLNGVKSVVLEEPCTIAAQLSMEKFWKCFCRVSNCLDDGFVLPGEGTTEMWCHRQIQQMAVSLSQDLQLSNGELVKVTILETLAHVFHDFADTVKQNTDFNQKGMQYSSQKFLNEENTCLPDLTTSRNQSDLSGRQNNQNFKKSMRDRGIDDCPTRCPTSYIESASNGCTDFIFRERRNHCDNFCSKASAWRSAIDLVSVLSSLDSLIITGASQCDLDINDVIL